MRKKIKNSLSYSSCDTSLYSKLLKSVGEKNTLLSIPESWTVRTLVKVALDETALCTVELGRVKTAFQAVPILVSWWLLSTKLNNVWEDHGCLEKDSCGVAWGLTKQVFWRLMKEGSSIFLVTYHLSLYACQMACVYDCRRRYEAAKKGSAWSCKTFFSLNWRDTDLIDGLLGRQGIPWVVTYKELQLVTQHPCGNQ